MFKSVKICASVNVGPCLTSVSVAWLIIGSRGQWRRRRIGQTVALPRVQSVATHPHGTSCFGVLLGVYTVRSSDRPVGTTGLSDWSVRRSYRVNVSFDRSDRRSDV